MLHLYVETTVGQQSERYYWAMVSLRLSKLTIASIVSLGLLYALQSRGAAERYAIETKLISVNSGSLLRIYDVATGKTQWQGKIGKVYSGDATKCLVWSKDKRAVAIVDDESGYWKRNWYYRLIVWRAGRPTKIYDDLPPLHEEGIDALYWSPDNHRLLLQSARGAGVQNSDLWCLRIGSNHVQFIAGEIGRAYWINSRRVWYCESLASQIARELPRKISPDKWQVKSYERNCN